MPISLAAGYPDKFIQRKHDINEHLDALVLSLGDYQKAARQQNLPPITPDIVTWRGMMTKILCTPYLKDAWAMNITLHNGTLYIEENVEGKQDRQDDLFTYFGYKFESLATHPLSTFERQEQSTDPPDQDTVNTNIQFCSVFKTRLGPHSLVLGAEVDCLLSDKPVINQPDRQRYYAELKTNRIITNARQYENFLKFKMLKVWAQSYLAGIPTIIFGYRDDKGMLQKVEHMLTHDIPRKARTHVPSSASKGEPRQTQHSPLWDPALCLNFAEQLLSWIKSSVQVDDRNVVYQLKFEAPYEQVTLTGPFYNQVSFLPDDVVST